MREKNDHLFGRGLVGQKVQRVRMKKKQTCIVGLSLKDALQNYSTKLNMFSS